MLGMTSVTFRNKSVEEIIEITEKCGLDAIEWGGDVHVPSGNILIADRTAELTEKAHLKVVSYGSYFRVGKESIDLFDKVLETARALNAPIIRIWCGDVPSDKTSDERFHEYVNDIKHIAKKAAEYGIIIASEYHNGTYNDSPVSALRLIKAVDMPNYKTYWQTLSFDDSDIESLKALLPYIVTVHVFAWNKYGRRYSLKKHYKKWRLIMNICKDSDINFIMEFVKRDRDICFIKDSATLIELRKDVSDILNCI